MKKLSLILFCFLFLSVITGCQEDDGGTGSSSSDLTGTWSGSGSFTSRSDGADANIPFQLEMTISQSGGTISGTFVIHPRPAAITRTGTITGTASGGHIELTLSPAWSLQGSYDGDQMNIELTEYFTGGDLDWIRGNSTLTRQ